MSLFEYPTRAVENVKPNRYLGQTTAPILAQLDSPESVDAGISNMERRASQRQRIIDFLQEHGGHTDEQIQDALAMNPNAERPRRRRLAQDGVVVRVGTAQTKAGNEAAVWGLR
jgi:hypothetical protein